MELDGWRRYFRVCREYGINHVRFHSWVPPEPRSRRESDGNLSPGGIAVLGDFDQHVKSVLQPEAVAIMRRLGIIPPSSCFTGK